MLTRYNLYSAAAVNGEPAPGYSSGDAVRAMQRLAETKLPAGYTYMLGATIIGAVLTPAFYVLIQTLTDRMTPRRSGESKV